MGRFDALTQLNQPVHHSPASASEAIPHNAPVKERKPDNLKTGKPENLKARQPDSPKTGLPESTLSGKPEIMKTGIQGNLKNEKYSTQLQPALIKQIKQYALEHDSKDYEVIQQAITEFLEKKK